MDWGTAVLKMGRKHKRSRLPSDESVSSLPQTEKARKRKLKRRKYSNRGHKTKNIRNKLSLANAPNPNFQEVRRRISRVVIPLRGGFDLRNVIGFRTSRTKNARNMKTPAITANPDIQQVRSRSARVIILPRSGIVETFDLRNVINFLTSKKKNVRNKTSVVAGNSNIQQEPSRNFRVVVPPRSRIVERYRIRNVHSVLHSRTKNAKNNTAPAITANPNIQKARSGNIRVVIPPRSPIVEGFDLKNAIGFRTARTNNARNSSAHPITANPNIQHARKGRACVLIPPTTQNEEIPDLKNGINFLTSRTGNAINNTAPAIKGNSNIQQEASRYTRVVIPPRTRIVERYRLLNVHSVFNSRMKKARNNTTPVITANPNIQLVQSRNTRVVIPPRRRIVERYKIRNVHSVLSSRTINAGNNTTHVVSDNASTQKVQRRIPTAAVEPLSQIVVWLEHGNRLARMRLEKNCSQSSITTNSHTQRVQRTSPCIEDGTQTEISERYGFQNEHGFRDSSVRSAKNDTSSVIAQDPDTQELSRFSRINDMSLNENSDNYGDRNEDELRVPKRRFSRNNPPMASEQNKDIMQAPSGSKNVDHWLLDETEEGYDSWTEHANRFYKFRNERDENSVLFAQNFNIQHTPRRRASAEYSSRRLRVKSAEGYECSICLDTRHQREMLYLQCFHKFHKKCINKWLNKYGMCPICRLSTEEVSDT